MAVDVKFSITQSTNGKTINFSETTGVYNATTNPTGWGAPNELTSDATAATLTIKDANETIYTVNLFSAGSFPKSTDTSFSIASTDLLSTLTIFADGFWEITYSVTTGTTTYTETNTFFFTSQVSALVCNLIADLDINDCDCDTDKVNKALQAKAYADSLCYAVGCGNLNGANEILTSLNRLINCC